jgi:hypothetical protein
VHEGLEAGSRKSRTGETFFKELRTMLGVQHKKAERSLFNGLADQRQMASDQYQGGLQ